jgi:leucyl/phenylalanyl-tRNA--protein transferase
MQIQLPWLGEAPQAPFPAASLALRQPNGLLAVGGDLSTPRLLNAYRSGIFPWYGPGEPILWWSPDPRCVFYTERMHVPRRLARSLTRSTWTVSADQDFAAVIDACAAPRGAGTGTWITPEMRAAYLALHQAGHAHSIEVRDADTLVGGLYGVAVGCMFFAESMFSVRSNGSKAALLALARDLRRHGWPLIDAQVPSDHLFTLGAQTMRRPAFLVDVAKLVAQPGLAGNWQSRFGRIPAAELV